MRGQEPVDHNAAGPEAGPAGPWPFADTEALAAGRALEGLPTPGSLIE